MKIDGRATFFEWVSAGRYACQNERGTMAMATQGPLEELFFGFDLNRLLVRVDCDGPARERLADCDVLRVGFVEPAGRELRLHRPGRRPACRRAAIPPSGPAGRAPRQGAVALTRPSRDFELMMWDV